MPRGLSTNEIGDIHAINGRLQISEGLTEVLQNCERAVKAQFGEMIFATNRGVNYFETVFNNSPNVVQFEQGLRSQLSRVEGVTSIESVNAEVVNNIARYTATIRTQFGTGTVSGEISG